MDQPGRQTAALLRRATVCRRLSTALGVFREKRALGDARVGRFRKHFPTYVYQNISACLKERQGVGAVILTCCAIDTLARYAAAGKNLKGNKARYLHFVENYFPNSYESELFYKIVRCGLVHAFDMERKFAILCSKEAWAQELHLKSPKGVKRIIINPYTLLRHMKRAQKELADDLDRDREFRRAFVKIYRESPIRPQYYRRDQVFRWLREHENAS